MDKARAAFREEAYERLAELEATMLELEESPENSELVDRAFRAMHTIKGSGAMFGFDAIAAFTHEIETVYDLVRNQQVPVTRELIALTLSAHDQIGALLEESHTGKTADEDRGRSIITSFQNLVPADEPPTDDTFFQESSLTPQIQEEKDSEPEPLKEKEATYRITFIPDANIFAYGTNPLLLLNELKQLGKCQVIGHIDKVPPIQDIDPEICYTQWDIILTTVQGVNAIKDIFIFVEDVCELSINMIDRGEEGLLGDEFEKKLGEILIERGDLKQEDLHNVLEEHKPIGKILEDSGLVKSSQIQAALAEQKHVKEARELRHKTESSSSIRVASDKLDTLVDLVGELVTVQARLGQLASVKNDADFLLIAEEVERLTAELRDNTMSARMLPIGSTFNKFKRLVRDLSNELGKDVLLTTDGADTELDKTVIEQLNDPLVHVIRNCIDHGIELPEIREADGKSKRGTIHLSAEHSGGNVLISIHDDGAGLDASAIRAKAVEKGIIAADAELSENEIHSLLFAPGLTTAESVTNVSGRGVGMDVVKRAIDALRGVIKIKSTPGAGTTIILKLPLTLAIIDGLLVKIGKNDFVLPLATVEECIELTRQDIDKVHGRHVANVRGSIIPYVHLREEFNIPGKSPDIEQIVITELHNQKVGFVVDYVIGEHQTVIKTLGHFYKNVEGISGATILGDGKVALILDVNQLLQVVEQEETQIMN
ncbi:MAG: chemotaxis protein CheA [SAR324 cluster bacterium]|nr:chemotaxis protein CheA [SAR324 cluster bacterium]